MVVKGIEAFSKYLTTSSSTNFQEVQTERMTVLSSPFLLISFVSEWMSCPIMSLKRSF